MSAPPDHCWEAALPSAEVAPADGPTQPLPGLSLTDPDEWLASGDHRSSIPLWITPSFFLPLAASGLLLQVSAYVAARAGSAGAIGLHYTGLVLLVAPCAGALLHERTPRRHRILAALTLGSLLYLSYYLYQPTLFVRFDELLHQITLDRLSRNPRLFPDNGILPVSPYYPGLELATLGVRWLTGVPLLVAEFFVVLVCRITLMTSLFLLGERVTRSSWAAGICVLIYATSPQFYFFNAQYAYQTPALSLSLGAVYLLTAALGKAGWQSLAYSAFAVGCLTALTVTHHLTSWITAAGLCAWSLVAGLLGHRRHLRIVGAAALITSALILGWSFLAGHRLISYLEPLFVEAASQFAGIVEGDQRSRTLFVNPGSPPTPVWEQALMLGSVTLWCTTLAAATLAAFRHRRVFGTRLALVSLIVAMVYGALQAARLSAAGWELAERASTFVFVAIALVVAGWVSRSRFARRPVLLLMCSILAFVGGVSLGSGPDYYRLPGSYLVSADQRSVDASALSAARWTRSLPPGSRIAADRVNSELIASIGGQAPVTAIGGAVNVGPLYFAPRIGRDEIDLLRRGRIEYVLVDERLATSLPMVGVYAETGETTKPQRLTPAELAKFGHTSGIHQVYDNRNIKIYDVRALTGATTLRTARPLSPVEGGANRLSIAAGLATLLLIAVRLWTRGPPSIERMLAGALVGGSGLIVVMLAATAFGLPAAAVAAVAAVAAIGLLGVSVWALAHGRLRRPVVRTLASHWWVVASGVATADLIGAAVILGCWSGGSAVRPVPELFAVSIDNTLQITYQAGNTSAPSRIAVLSSSGQVLWSGQTAGRSGEATVVTFGTPTAEQICQVRVTSGKAVPLAVTPKVEP